MIREEILQLAQELDQLGKSVAIGKALSTRCFQAYVLRALAAVLRLLIRP